jgi:hypothetical protein
MILKLLGHFFVRVVQVKIWWLLSCFSTIIERWQFGGYMIILFMMVTREQLKAAKLFFQKVMGLIIL